MDHEHQRLLAEIERRLTQEDPGLAGKFAGWRDRRLAVNSQEAAAFRRNLKIMLLVVLIGLVVAGVGWYLIVHFHPVHMPDMPYTHLGG